MTKLNKLIILLFILNYSCKEKTNSEIVNSNFVKHQLLINNKNITFLFYDSGELFAYGEEVNNLKNGKWYYFNKNGHIAMSGMYENSQKVGRWNYYENMIPYSLGSLFYNNETKELDSLISIEYNSYNLKFVRDKKNKRILLYNSIIYTHYNKFNKTDDFIILEEDDYYYNQILQKYINYEEHYLHLQ